MDQRSIFIGGRQRFKQNPTFPALIQLPRVKRTQEPLTSKGIVGKTCAAEKYGTCFLKPTVCNHSWVATVKVSSVLLAQILLA